MTESFDAFKQRLRVVIEDTRSVLEAIHDDDILSANFLDGGEQEMQRPNKLQGARERVNELQKIARAAQSKKEKLDKQWKTAQTQTESLRQKFTLRASARLVDVFTWNPNPDADNEVAAVAPGPSLEQQAKYAHIDWVEACYNVSAAKVDLARLEKKVQDLAALQACVEVL